MIGGSNESVDIVNDTITTIRNYYSATKADEFKKKLYNITKGVKKPSENLSVQQSIRNLYNEMQAYMTKPY